MNIAALNAKQRDQWQCPAAKRQMDEEISGDEELKKSVGISWWGYHGNQWGFTSYQPFWCEQSRWN